ncbi:MAG TPA: rRNA maturation RNase YbeY [Clostridiaceae bacterium]|nr:rRNA maturation RNase YbeY [Clostridiaceae bacterium]
MEILVENNQEKVIFTDSLKQLITKAVKLCLEEETFTENVEVNILLVDNEKIREMNHHFRQIDAPTDVLSFPILEMVDGKLIAGVGDYNYDGETLLLGDIVISLEMAKAQAEEYGHSFERELGFLVTHGMFHLLGYDHCNELEEKRMMDKQEKVLKVMELTR